LYSSVDDSELPLSRCNTPLVSNSDSSPPGLPPVVDAVMILTGSGNSSLGVGDESTPVNPSSWDYAVDHSTSHSDEKYPDGLEWGIAVRSGPSKVVTWSRGRHQSTAHLAAPLCNVGSLVPDGPPGLPPVISGKVPVPSQNENPNPVNPSSRELSPSWREWSKALINWGKKSYTFCFWLFCD